MSYIAFDLDALNEAPAVARFAGVSEDLVIAGMARMWAWCFREKVDIASSGQVRGLFGVDLTEALTEFGYLAPDEHSDGHWRVRGADRYLRVAAGRSKGGKAAAASGNLKRGLKRDVDAVVARAVEVQSQLAPSLVPALPPAAPQLAPRLSPSTEHRAPNTETKEIQDPVASVVGFWNLLPDPFPRVTKVTPKRRTATEARLRDTPELKRWERAIAVLPGSPFLRGENDRGWVANFDWLMRPDTLTKLEEGNYSGTSPPRPKSLAPARAEDSRAAFEAMANLTPDEREQAALEAFES